MGVRTFVLGVAAIAALAGSASATVMDGHFMEGDLHGDWDLTAQSFVPASQAAWGFDTLSVEEHVPGYVFDGQDPAREYIGRPAERWSDLWVTVFRDVTPGANYTSMVAFDKRVLNYTDNRPEVERTVGRGYHWTDFHIELGVGLHENFGGVPGLDFKLDPPPQEENDVFPDPPMYRPGADVRSGAPSLWWDINQSWQGDDGTNAIDTQYPGVHPGEYARFWFAITIPDMMFVPQSGGRESATIVLRQHWTPTPGAAGVMALAFGVAGVRRRRSN